jgi:DNA polymerase III subunit gamma/tau
VSLDTKYRPLRYSDVLGQEATIQVCKEYVRSGHGFRQSYVFAGGHGGGKTTMGHILARALLCSSPVEGEPCDQCSSCLAMLDDRSEGFIEVDAATNSGKDHVRRITEEAQFGTYSGQRRIYLFDECHEMSRQAFDALLKPLEDNIRGTQDKQLVCIFCTTEVEKMRPAVLSRCAPVFRIRPNTPEQIASRLTYICQQEEIEYDAEVLPLIAEVVECHVRDAVKAIEGVSMLGPVNRNNVNLYLSLGANDCFLEVLENLGKDAGKALQAADQATQLAAPGVCYEKMADLCVLGYRLAYTKSVQVPSYWDRERLTQIGEQHKDFLIEFAQRFAARPGHPSASMFLCDVSALHQKRAGIVLQAAPTQVQVPNLSTPLANPVGAGIVPVQSSPEPPKTTRRTGSIDQGVHVTDMGVSINPLAQHSSRKDESAIQSQSGGLAPLPAPQFAELLHRRIQELTGGSNAGSARRNNLGST